MNGRDEPQPGDVVEKVDPESLILRGKPARAIRFKRGAIVSLAAIAAVTVTGTAWFALRPHALQIVASGDDQPVVGKSSPDAFGALPATYGDAPKLGPPLPGDLGRPILDQQRINGTAAVPPINTGQAEREASDRRAADLKAARESGLLFRDAQPTAIGATPADKAAASSSSSDGDVGKVALDPERDPNGQQRKSDFLRAQDRGGDVNSFALAPAPSPYALLAGSVIAASLITGLRSDLPGLVTAQVTERVYDSATGKILLIPQGARLIGAYDSVVAFGQKRALLVWQRLILPDGSSVRIDNVPATDPSGYSGLADKVDFHTWALLKGVVMSTLLGVGSELQFSNESDLVQALRQSTQQSGSRAGDQLTSRSLQIQPKITIRPGASVRLVVHKDLILAPWRQ
ncbi:MAG: TrbI/VirB10 family protein [Sphingomonas sp.]